VESKPLGLGYFVPGSLTYSDKHSEFFGRINEDGNEAVFQESGEAATRMDAACTWLIRTAAKGREGRNVPIDPKMVKVPVGYKLPR